MENSRVKQKYLEIKEENNEILERIGEISNILNNFYFKCFIEKQISDEYKTNQELWNEFSILKSYLQK